MYGAFWRVLPGPWWFRLIIVFVIVVAILSACVLWIFPAIQPYVSPSQDVTVNQ